MKKIILAVYIASNSLTASAACQGTEEMSSQRAALISESAKLEMIADYLRLRVEQKGGDYEGNPALLSLMIEVRKDSLKLTNASARLQLKITDEVLKCSKF